WYLNHYYLILILAFMMIWMPANQYFSLDRYFGFRRTVTVSSFWQNALKIQTTIVYFFAALAKFNADWIFEALPLRIWLANLNPTPGIGSFLSEYWVASLFSIGGLCYDLSIPLLLWYRRTRFIGIALVILFHLLTAVLFPIGMFPYLMIACAFLFLTDEDWQWVLSYFFPSSMSWDAGPISNEKANLPSKNSFSLIQGILVVHLLIQVILPSRRFFHQDAYLWTERHFRFGWNVMIVDKKGLTTFKVYNHDSNAEWRIDPLEHLTPVQNLYMSYQADMIWQFAQFLKTDLNAKGFTNISIYPDSFVTLNGRPSKRYLPTDLDLLSIKMSHIYRYVLD
ncbi:MAG: HTTM domain-containing protein, partial [Bacteroidota bacterium]